MGEQFNVSNWFSFVGLMPLRYLVFRWLCFDLEDYILCPQDPG